MQIRTAEISSVHKKELVAKPFLRSSRTTHITIDSHNGCIGMDVHQVIGHICSQHILYPEFQRLGRSEHIDILVIVSKSESYVGTSQGYVGKLRHYMLELHRVRFEELTPGRNVIKKIPDSEIRASRNGYLLCRKMLRVREVHLTA